MKENKLKLIELFKFQLKEMKSVHSLWLGGSAATGKEDELSDLDFVIIADEAGIVFQAIEYFLKEDIESTWEVKGTLPYCQKFYILGDLEETFYLDIVVFTELSPESYSEYFLNGRHGTPVILFDKAELLKKASLIKHQLSIPEIDWKNSLAQTEILFRTFMKEVKREKFIDSYAFYLRLLQTMIQLLRVIHSPLRHDFGMRYITLDLPPDEAAFIESLLKISTLEEMRVNAVKIKEKIHCIGIHIIQIGQESF